MANEILNEAQKKVLAGDIKEVACLTRGVKVSKTEADKKTDTTPVALPTKKQEQNKN